jgi:carboxypeptidase Q
LYRIKDEGLQRSKMMEIESYLTDVYGPRLTGSPNIKEAGDWAQKTMRDWGLSNVHVERWPFGRGWQNQQFMAQALTPRAYPLPGFQFVQDEVESTPGRTTRTWTSTNGSNRPT